MAELFESFVAKEMKPALQKRSREKAGRMLKAGHLLVEEHGYDGMRISDIAKEAGCSVGSFYERFSDKENFFQLMLGASISQGTGDIGRYLEPSRWEGVPLDVVISKSVYQIVSWFRQRKGLYCAALTAPRQNDQNFRPFRHSSMKTSKFLTQLLEARRSEMNCADIESSVWFAIQMINGALVLAALSEISGTSGTRAEKDNTIMIDDPELVVQLTRSTCAYLGIPMTEATQKMPDGDVKS